MIILIQRLIKHQYKKQEILFDKLTTLYIEVMCVNYIVSFSNGDYCSGTHDCLILRINKPSNICKCFNNDFIEILQYIVT